MKRHLQATKKALHFDSKKYDWCTYENFWMMYDHVYEVMVDIGVAINWIGKCGLTLKE